MIRILHGMFPATQPIATRRLAALALTLATSILTGLSARAAGNNWLSSLPDAQPLTRITLPGTHNSGALHEPYPGTAKCQSIPISDQLNAGIRLLDLRCRHMNNSFRIYHGPIDQKLDFTTVLAELKGFLTKNPRECVVISIKEEGKETDCTRTFEDTFRALLKDHNALWLLSPTPPTLGEARGRLILLRRFKASPPLGIDASEWPDNTTFSTGTLTVQDLYEPGDVPPKWTAIRSALKAAHTDTNPAHIHLNFTSGYRTLTLGLPNIPAIAGPINERLAIYFRTAPRGAHGWLMMDFTTPELATTIANANTPQSPTKK